MASAAEPVTRAAEESDRAPQSSAASAARRLQRQADGKPAYRRTANGPALAPPHPLGPAQRSAFLDQTGIQPALLISQPGDAAEAEADRVADRVIAMKEPDGALAAPARSPLIVQRATARAPTPPPPQPIAETVADAATEAAVKAELAAGTPMAPDVAGFFGRRFGANFGDVRFHTDAKAANLSTRLGARAFTYGRHIFFNAGQYDPESEGGAKLIAHELAHTIQQQAVIQLKEDASAPPRVTSRSAPKAQRGIVSRALNWVADKANIIPGFRLFTIVIGLNPINMANVDRSGANILRALIEFIPGGGLIVDALNNHGIFEKGGKFIEDQFHSLGMVGAAFRDALMEFIDSLSWSDVFHLGSVWDRAKRIFTDPVDKLIGFGKGLVTGIARIVKDAILKPLGRYAAGLIPKFDMLAGVFGKNPVSGENVSPANALIGGFMKLIGQEEIWENIQKSGAVGKAWSWFKGALSGALALVRTIPDRFIGTLKSLTIFDIVSIVGAWAKFAKLFAGFVADFAGWAGKQVLKLLEIILEVVAPSVIPYLKKAGAAFNTIIKAPGRFIGYLVKAGKAGFMMFKTNILQHLQRGLLDWLLGSLAGANLHVPKSFVPTELLKFGLSVLGLTWGNIRAKLVAATSETTVKVLETGFDIVRKLVTEGPAAAWEELVKTLSNLKSMVIDAIIDFVKGKVIEIAIEKVLSFLNPAGAFIQALLAIYRTVTFIIDKLRQIGALVAALIDGIAAIAVGNIGPAAARVESVLAKGLSLAISFLANFVGLGNVSKKIIEIIGKIRKPVDQALDKLVTWIVDKAKAVGKMVVSGGKAVVGSVLKALGVPVTFTGGGEAHRLWVDVKGGGARVMMASTTRSMADHIKDFQARLAGVADPIKGKVRKAIGIVTPLNSHIEAQARTVVGKPIGDQDRDRVNRDIEATERKMQPPLLVILDGLAIATPKAIKKITCTFIKSPWTTDPGLAGEWDRQLKRQQAQINTMSVHIWMERRAQFAQFKKQPDAKPLDANARRKLRERFQKILELRIKKPEGTPASHPEVAPVAKVQGLQLIADAIYKLFTPMRRKLGLTPAEAAYQAEQGLKNKAVLHEPDKVAGGRYDEIQDIGANPVNSDIGANWGGINFGAVTGRIHLANMIERTAKDELTKTKVEPALWRAVNMDVELKT